MQVVGALDCPLSSPTGGWFVHLDWTYVFWPEAALYDIKQRIYSVTPCHLPCLAGDAKDSARALLDPKEQGYTSELLWLPHAFIYAL